MMLFVKRGNLWELGEVIWTDPLDPDVVTVEFRDGCIEETRISYCRRLDN